MKFISFLLFITAFLFIGCSKSNNISLKIKQNSNPSLKYEVNIKSKENSEKLSSTNYSSNNLDEVIVEIAKQLFTSNTVKNKPTHIILTSFVNLDNLSETTTFGRMLSESMFNELHINKFNVTDFRGQDAISVTKDGEFHITREVDKLKDSIEKIEYILVGTYVKFENKSFLINSRIIDSISGNVISSSRVIYQPEDCSLYNLCNKIKLKKEQIIHKNPIIEKNIDDIIEQNPIMIIEDK